MSSSEKGRRTGLADWRRPRSQRSWVALGLAACGSSGGGIEGGGSQEVETVKLEGKPSGSLTISNWPLYIDKETVPNFEKATGIKVKYIEDINSNEEFFSKMQPLLQEGESGGRSIFVLAGYETSKMYKLGYLQNLDKIGAPERRTEPAEEPAAPALRSRTAPTRCPGRAG